MNAKVRGIYTTGITKTLLDAGFTIIQPTKTIQERFKLEAEPGEADVSIWDREDRQGIILRGRKEVLEVTLKIFRDRFPDAIIHRFENGPSATIEFPSISKQKFDELRGIIVKTIPKHHFYKVAGEHYGFTVDFAENLLEAGVDEKTVADRLEKTSLERWKTGSLVEIEHVKLDGWVLKLASGKIIGIRSDGTGLLQRVFRGKGVYDGLNLPKEPGDYAITEVREGSWIVKSAYYSKDREFKGEYYNINTPVEIYWDRIRYVDLEVDVLRWPDGKVEIIDSAKLEEAYHNDIISQWLLEEAKRRAEELRASILKSQQDLEYTSTPTGMYWKLLSKTAIPETTREQLET